MHSYSEESCMIEKSMSNRETDVSDLFINTKIGETINETVFIIERY